MIAVAPSPEAFGHPRLGLINDYDAPPARLAIAYTLSTGSVTQLVTRIITLPSAESFTQGRPCLTCPSDEASKPGYALMGRVIQLIPENHLVIIDHPEVPGILPAGKRNFLTDDQTLALLRNGVSLLARIEQRDGAWWLFDVKTLAPQNHH